MPSDPALDAVRDRRDAPTGLERVRQNRDDLEKLTDSDLPVSEVAQALLDAVNDAGD